MNNEMVNASSATAVTPASATGLTPVGPDISEDQFVARHLGPRPREVQEMLKFLGFASLDDLSRSALPDSIQFRQSLSLPSSRTESQALTDLAALANQNQVFRSFLGMGYYDCVTPPVIQRNILENPGWYTQYTPYQAEISQGRLEALLNFQTLITELTGLEIANASLLDEATAAAEAMNMCFSVKGRSPGKRILVSAECHPQTINVVKTRAHALGVQVTEVSRGAFQFDPDVFAVLVQYPDTNGIINNFDALVQQAHQAGAMVIVAADLLSLVLLRPPGEFGADIAVGSAQRFGVPLGFGGPHAAFFATRDAYKRLMPGRLVGVSHDAQGHPAFRLALQTREQHIRREKATSNICTAQVLLAIMAVMYAVYHGPQGLIAIARRVLWLTRRLAHGLAELGFRLEPGLRFDTLRVILKPADRDQILTLACKHSINLRVFPDGLGISLDETTRVPDVAKLLAIFNRDAPLPFALDDLPGNINADFDPPFARRGAFLAQPVFNQHHSETEMLRYLKRLEARDLSLTATMIPLGSCTMKLNATTEMMPVSWPGFARMHPYAPADQTQGYRQLLDQLAGWLEEITGLGAVSLQPNAGSQGEYTGLLVIRTYHQQSSQHHRTVCLIPQSAHGTNPASAVLAGMTVVPVACDAFGNIDFPDLKRLATAHAKNLAALMITYPSTHGVFEDKLKDICQLIHDSGGLVYLDGANMNALVGLCRPGDIGIDVCHLNLHKTFSIPHGGGGPGMAPIVVRKDLAQFLPGHPLHFGSNSSPLGPVSGAPYGSAGILMIPWAYIAMMGAAGLKQATQTAILNANYIAKKLDPYYPVLYRGQNGLVAHECILDFRQFHQVTVEDVAKRLMDYGFHAPTISWPVPGTMMVEPTESEPRQELDRFCEAMIAIHAEILEIENGQVDAKNNLLKNAPHPAVVVTADSWRFPYSRERAAYPVPSLKNFKFWPAVARIDNVYGDRNLVCSCAGFELAGT
jgi:glycine dehydrogenase